MNAQRWPNGLTMRSLMDSGRWFSTILWLAALAGAGCPDRSVGPAPSEKPMHSHRDRSGETAPWHLVYSDGSGNRHELRGEANGALMYGYTPITPEQSSSGTYHGGPPWQGLLDPEGARRLIEALGRLDARAAIHAHRREMGTGLFQLTRGGEARRFLIRPGPELSAWDQLLQGLRR